jgi:hypothetical protein
MNEKGTFEKWIRKSYRTLIVICAIAVILSILALYFGGSTDKIELPL